MMPVITIEQAILQVGKVIQSINGAKPETLNRDDRIVIDLEMDSVELIDLLIKLEEIGVTLGESQLSSNLTVGHLAELVLFAQQPNEYSASN